MANLLDDEKALGGISTIMMHYTNGDYTSYTLTDISEGAKLDNSLFPLRNEHVSGCPPPDLRNIGALLCAIPQAFLETLKTARDVYILCTKSVQISVNLFGLTIMALSGLRKQKCTFAF